MTAVEAKVKDTVIRNVLRRVRVSLNEDMNGFAVTPEERVVATCFRKGRGDPDDLPRTTQGDDVPLGAALRGDSANESETSERLSHERAAALEEPLGESANRRRSWSLQ